LNDERDKYRREFDEREGEIESIRAKFQREIKGLTEELEHEKTVSRQLKESSRSTQSSIDDLRLRLDEETRNASMWKKDKERLEARIADLNRVYDESVNSHEQLQAKTSQLINQVRELRGNLEEVENQKSVLERSKRTLEVQLEELNDQFNEVNKSKLILEKNAVSLEATNREQKVQLEEALEQAQVETEKARRAEAGLSELNVEADRQREHVNELEGQKNALEKQYREVQLRVSELEAVVSADRQPGVRVWETKMNELTGHLDRVQREKEDYVQQVRRHERVIRDLQTQLAEKEKTRQRYEDDVNKSNDKMRRMKQDMLALEARESDLGLAKRRLERELDECQQTSTQLEREVGKLRARLAPV